MGDAGEWLISHPLESPEANVMFWIAVVGFALVLLVVRFGRF